MIVFTIHRYVFSELFRVFLLTTVALTIILSLGSTIAPIQQYGVGPAQVFSILIYFLPITLTFVLPISAMFAASLVYGRLAHDNELEACRASGISLTTVIYPGMSLAILVAICTLVLSFYVVPDFVHRAEKTVKDNAKQILFRNIQRKGFYEIPGGNRKFKIQADHALPDDDMLIGVVITEMTGDAYTKVITADNAKVKFEAKDRYNEVTVAATETYQIDAQGNQVYSSFLPISGQFESLLADKIKFQTIAEIKKIRANMLNFNPVYDLAQTAGAQLGMELLAKEIQQQSAEDIVDYYPLESMDKIVLINAAGTRVRDLHTIELLGPIKVVEMRRDIEAIICTYECDTADLRLDGDDVDSELVLMLKNTSWQLADGIKSLAPAPRRTFQNLRFPAHIQALLTPDRLMSSVDNVEGLLGGPPSDILKRARAITLHKSQDALNEITSETHSRLVFGVGCISLILLSITFGVQLKGGHLLSAFGVSVIPAAILIVCIMAGKNLITSPAEVPQMAGVVLMWGCLAVLSLFTLISYRRLTRV